MFDRFLRESLDLQLYGKLPLAKDYLRVGASRGRSRALRDWLDAAFSSQVNGERPPTVPWPMRYVLAAGTQHPVMGSSWPSSDMGGERAFPFAMFVERRRKALAASLARGLGELEPIWEEIEVLYAQAAEHRDGSAFLAAMRGRTVALPSERAAGPWLRLVWERWVAALWPERGVQGLESLLERLAGAETVRGPVRLPLAVDVPLLPQVRAWWVALEALQVIGPSALPSVVFPQPLADDQEPAFCVFFLRELGIEDARWVASLLEATGLGPNDYCGEEVCRVADEGAVREGGVSLADSMRGLALSVRARA